MFGPWSKRESTHLKFRETSRASREQQPICCFFVWGGFTSFFIRYIIIKRIINNIFKNMKKGSSLIIGICDWVMKYSIYTAIFLTPIFFLPWTAEVLDFNKQALLILLGFLAIFAWMLKSLISNKFEINLSKIQIIVGVLFLIYLFSTLFSINKQGSFWGWPSSTSESLLSLIIFIIFYFLVSNVFSKKNILVSTIVLLVSAFIAELFGFLQLLGIFIIPSVFTKSISFNTVGSISSLGFFVAILLPIIIVMIIISKKQWRIFFLLQLVLSALILFAINYPLMWWAVLLGAVVLMVLGAIKRELFDGRWMALPVFFIAISLFFILLNPQISWLSRNTSEITLSQKASSEISLQAIKERPIFGSGPGTFSYNFLKFKNANFSQSPLWDVTFKQATSKAWSDLASVGILGLLVMLFLIFVPVFYGIKFLVGEKKMTSGATEKEGIKVYWVLVLGFSAALSVNALMYFLYNPSFVILFINFIIVGGLVSLVFHEKAIYELKPSSITTLVVTFIFTLVFIFGLGIMILGGQKYVAEVNHYQGLTTWQEGNSELGLQKLEKAASLNPSSDLYFKQLSQAYLAILQQKMTNANTEFSDEEKNNIQILIANSVNAAVAATNLNPKEANNWTNRGYIYQSLNGLIGDTTNWTMEAYEQALKLDPNNPYILTQEGVANFIAVSSLEVGQVEQKKSLLSAAKEKLEKAVTLNPDYSNGLYMLGLVYDALGQKNKAMQQFTKVQELNPEDDNVKKILSNLKAGLPALQTSPQIEPPEGSEIITEEQSQ